jgi:hypothetical protein
MEPVFPPPMYSFFVKTEEALHQGGFIFFSLEQFEEARPVLEKEVTHICESNNHKLRSWGLMDSSGQVVKEFKAKGN